MTEDPGDPDIRDRIQNLAYELRSEREETLTEVRSQVGESVGQFRSQIAELREQSIAESKKSNRILIGVLAFVGAFLWYRMGSEAQWVEQRAETRTNRVQQTLENQITSGLAAVKGTLTAELAGGIARLEGRDDSLSESVRTFSTLTSVLESSLTETRAVVRELDSNAKQRDLLLQSLVEQKPASIDTLGKMFELNHIEMELTDLRWALSRVEKLETSGFVGLYTSLGDEHRRLLERVSTTPLLSTIPNDEVIVVEAEMNKREWIEAVAPVIALIETNDPGPFYETVRFQMEFELRDLLSEKYRVRARKTESLRTMFDR